MTAPTIETGGPLGPLIGPIQGTWRLKLYREDGSTPVVYENVKHVFWQAGNTVFVIAQYTGGPQQEAHHYVHWLREHFVWYRLERTDPDRAAALRSARRLVLGEDEPQQSAPEAATRMALGCDCGATVVEACLRHTADDLWEHEDGVLSPLAKDGCEAARTVLTQRHV